MVHHVGGACFGFKCHKMMNCIDLEGSLREVWLQVCFCPFPWRLCADKIYVTLLCQSTGQGFSGLPPLTPSSLIASFNSQTYL